MRNKLDNLKGKRWVLVVFILLVIWTLLEISVLEIGAAVVFTIISMLVFYIYKGWL